MLEFEYRRIDQLPKLAWCARIRRHDPTVVVEHGPWVETHDGFFAEGAWNGDFRSGDFDECTVLLGSAGKIVDDRIILCPTTHTMDRLQSCLSKDEFVLSNSLAYLLQALDDQLHPRYRFYERDLMTFLRGYTNARTSIPTLSGRRINLHYHRAIDVTLDLEIYTRTPSQPPHFANYSEYVSYTNETVRSICQNSNDSNRNTTYAPLTTISSGYDSPACAVFAKSVGCHQAVTFSDARPDRKDHRSDPLGDSGKDIAERLDMDVLEFSRDGYLTLNDFPEAEFIATGNGGDDVVMGILGENLARKVLFTGFLGDTFWGLSTNTARSGVFRYVYPPGGTLTEFRLRAGFVHMPIPLLTFTRHADVQRIGLSEEMSPWRLGRNYDRPVPRRIAEEAGIPRELFGLRKKAVTQPFWGRGKLEAMMTRNSWNDFQTFKDSVQLNKIRLSDILPSAIAEARIWSFRKIRYEGKGYYVRRLKLAWIIPLLAFDVATPNSASFKGKENCQLFHWAISKVSERYGCTSLSRNK